MNFKQVCECLETSISSTASTTIKISTTTLSGCGSPQWSVDNWCDDENNNVACNFDGGACCNNDFPGWDAYCQVNVYPHHVYEKKNEN